LYPLSLHDALPISLLRCNLVPRQKAQFVCLKQSSKRAKLLTTPLKKGPKKAMSAKTTHRDMLCTPILKLVPSSRVSSLSPRKISSCSVPSCTNQQTQKIALWQPKSLLTRQTNE